ncbi:MAG: pitrilysin family protein [Gammaproteobacteria bacterium]
MYRLLILLVAASAVSLGACTAQESRTAASTADGDDRMFDMPYEMRDLPNGLRVIVVPTDYPDIVTLQIPVATGSRNEVEPGKSGFAHFFEHMMFRGTDQYPPDEYGRILKNAGADQNAYTSDDLTNYHITFTKADLEKMIELEADRFQNLSYSEELFRTEAQAVKGEYLKNYSNPLLKMLETMRRNHFTTHTYRHTTMGFFEDIEDMPNQMEYSKVFFDRWYRPENTTIILVGDLDPEATFGMVERYWGDWEQGDYTVDIPEEPAPTGPDYEHIKWDGPTPAWVMSGFRGPAYERGDKAMPAMDLLASVYFSQTSDLYQKLVIQEQVVDQLFAYFPTRKDPGLLTIAARLLDDSKAAYVHEEIMKTLARARTERVPVDRLEDIKSNLRYSFAGAMDNSETIGEVLASYVHYERTPETLNDYYAATAAVTPADLMAYANEYFVDIGRSTVTLSTGESLAGFAGERTLVDDLVADLNAKPAADVEFVEMRSETSPLVDVSLMFHTGAAYEPAGKRGIATLTAMMITDGGSENRTLREINQALFPLAAGFSAQVDKEMTRLAGTVHRDRLDDWYKIVSDQLLNPGWREDDFKRLKTQLIAAIRTNLRGNNDEEFAKEVLYEALYVGHPYGSLNMGDVSDIEAITLADVQAFYESQFTAANVTVGLAGGYPASFTARLNEDLTGLPAGERNDLDLPEPPSLDGHRAIVIQKETPGVAVSFGFPIDVTRSDPDWVALWLARSWLGEHRSSNSHLYQRIRETRGMNYGDYAYIEYFPGGMFRFQPSPNVARQQQIFQVWIRPLRDNNDAHFATRVAMYELRKVLDEGMTAAQFEETRNFLDKYVSLLVKTQGRQLGYALDSDWYGTDAFTDYVRAGLADLTLDDVNAAIRAHWQVDDIQFVFISKDANDLAERLVSNRVSEPVYNAEMTDEVKAEDAVIKSLELGFTAATVTVKKETAFFE